MAHIFQVPSAVFDPYHRTKDLFYAPVEKSIHRFCRDEAFLWSVVEGVEGIVGSGRIVTDVVKPSAIPDDVEIYDPNHLQVGVSISNLSLDKPIIPKSIAYQLPSFIQWKWKQQTMIANSLNYFVGDISSEFRFFTEEYYHLFYNYRGYVTEGNWAFGIHVLRERFLIVADFRSYSRMLNLGTIICDYCKTNFEEKYGRSTAEKFIELHDSSPVYPHSKSMIDIADFRMICPNCHKYEHEKILARSA